MTGINDDSPQTTLENLAHNYMHMFAISILYFDHLLTIGQEVESLWERRKTRSSYWFFANRYIAFFGNLVVTVVGFYNLSGASCKKYHIFRELLLLVNQVLVCVLLTLRIYALYGCSKRVLVWMVGSGLALMSISCWALFGQKTAPAARSSGCHIGLSRETSLRLAGAWEALFVYDSIIFGMTLYKTWLARRDHGVTGVDVPLIALILRDGAIYFAIMALCNLSNILTFYLAGPFLRGSLSTFASCTSVTMMSRLMLNLHKSADAGIYSTHATSTGVDYRSNWTATGVLDSYIPPSSISDIETNPGPHPQRGVLRRQ